MQNNVNGFPSKKTVPPEKLVTVATFRGREEAHLCRGKLQSEGIVSFVVENHPAGLRMSSNIQLQVKESQALRRNVS